MTDTRYSLEKGMLFFVILTLGAHGVQAQEQTTHTTVITVPLIPFIALLVLLCWCCCCRKQDRDYDRHGLPVQTVNTMALPKEATPVYTLPTNQDTEPRWSVNDAATTKEDEQTQEYTSRDHIVTPRDRDGTTSTDCSHSSANTPPCAPCEAAEEATDMEKGIGRHQSVDANVEYSA